MRHRMVSFDEAAQAGREVCGGKGWNLGRLVRYGFPVPRGGVLTAATHVAHVASPPIAAGLAALADVDAGATVHPEVIERLSRLREAILAQPLPDAVEDEIATFLAERGLAGQPVAVRSSAVAEDGGEVSFAGVHESVLGVTGCRADLGVAIRRVYASLWTPQALAYRRRQGVPDRAAACAVVIQAMAWQAGNNAPALAGVAFSCDPRSGQRDLICIEAHAGAGEAVVAGQVVPEGITVQDRGSDLVISRAVSGTRCETLADDTVEALARLVLRVHWALGDGQDPQDLEWAHDGTRLWLLQARPATGVPRRSFADQPPIPSIWSSANIQEALPGVPTIYTWSMVQKGLTIMLRAPLDTAGYPVPDGLELVRRFSGHAYFDLTTLQWTSYDCFGVRPAELNEILGGHQPEIEVPPGSPYRGLAGLRRLRRNLQAAWKLLGLPRRLHRWQERFATELPELLECDLSRLGDHELRELLLERWRVNADFMTFCNLLNSDSCYWQLTLHRALRRVAGRRGGSIATRLMAGRGGLPSADLGYRMFDLARIAREDEEALAALRQGNEPVLSLPATSPFRHALDGFLRDLGHRAADESELAVPRWREDPTYVLTHVRQLAEEPAPRDPREAAAAVGRQAMAELRGLLCLRRPFFLWLARRAHRSARQREAARSLLVSLVEPARLVALEVGRRLQARGRLSAVDDVFHLSHAAMDSFLTGHWDGSGARALVADRRRQIATWRTESPADVIGGGAVAPAPCAPATRGATGWSGLAVSSGQVRGPARVVRDPAEGARLRPGEILVAHTTDPSWTPLFLRASGLAAEVGGYLSHAATVAREYGLPAVVNLPGLLAEVEDGDVLFIDGTAGTVVVERNGR